MRRYNISITGTQPLLMHADSIEWSDQMDIWKASKDNKAVSKAGDDRSPAWRWLGAMYHDGQNLVMPMANLMRCLMEGGAMVPVPGGKSGKTFKSQSQSGIIGTAIHWPILIGGEPVPVASLLKLNGEPDFAKHQKAALALGFKLFLKRAKIGASKHVRVRPQFDKWGFVATVGISDDQITTDALTDIIEMGGKYKGLGDWRPGGKTPGSYGMFQAKVTQLKE